jgi:polysaccharide biosynthesis protein PslH
VKILVVSPQFPYPPRSGFATRVYHLARQLAARHKVTLLSYAQPRDHAGVTALAKELSVHVVDYGRGSLPAKRVAQALSILSARPYYCSEWYSEPMQRAIVELCSREHFDIIQLESSFLCAFRFPRPSQLVIDEHNIEYEVFRRMGDGEQALVRRAFNWIEYRRHRDFEQEWWNRVGACVVTSEREREIVCAYAPNTAVEVVPNGVDLAYFRPEPDRVADRTLVFNGILTYRPNRDAARHLIHDIWPLVLARYPDAQLTIVGRSAGVDLRDMRRPGIRFVGEVPDIRPALCRAAVVAVPVRIGGGTRLKAIESLAMGKATVSTSLGCEGLAVRDGEHLLIADDPQTFATRVLQLFDDPERRDTLGRAGRRLVEQEYSWELGGERLEALYQRIAVSQPADTGFAASVGRCAWQDPAHIRAGSSHRDA